MSDPFSYVAKAMAAKKNRKITKPTPPPPVAAAPQVTDETDSDDKYKVEPSAPPPSSSVSKPNGHVPEDAKEETVSLAQLAGLLKEDEEKKEKDKDKEEKKRRPPPIHIACPTSPPPPTPDHESPITPRAPDDPEYRGPNPVRPAAAAPVEQQPAPPKKKQRLIDDEEKKKKEQEQEKEKEKEKKEEEERKAKEKEKEKKEKEEAERKEKERKEREEEEKKKKANEKEPERKKSPREATKEKNKDKKKKAVHDSLSKDRLKRLRDMTEDEAMVVADGDEENNDAEAIVVDDEEAEDEECEILEPAELDLIREAMRTKDYAQVAAMHANLQYTAMQQEKPKRAAKAAVLCMEVDEFLLKAVKAGKFKDKKYLPPDDDDEEGDDDEEEEDDADEGKTPEELNDELSSRVSDSAEQQAAKEEQEYEESKRRSKYVKEAGESIPDAYKKFESAIADAVVSVGKSGASLRIDEGEGDGDDEDDDDDDESTEKGDEDQQMEDVQQKAPSSKSRKRSAAVMESGDQDDAGDGEEDQKQETKKKPGRKKQREYIFPDEMVCDENHLAAMREPYKQAAELVKTSKGKIKYADKVTTMLVDGRLVDVIISGSVIEDVSSQDKVPIKDVAAKIEVQHQWRGFYPAGQITQPSWPFKLEFVDFYVLADGVGREFKGLTAQKLVKQTIGTVQWPHVFRRGNTTHITLADPNTNRQYVTVGSIIPSAMYQKYLQDNKMKLVSAKVDLPAPMKVTQVCEPAAAPPPAKKKKTQPQPQPPAPTPTPTPAPTEPQCDNPFTKLLKATVGTRLETLKGPYIDQPAAIKVLLANKSMATDCNQDGTAVDKFVTFYASQRSVDEDLKQTFTSAIRKLSQPLTSADYASWFITLMAGYMWNHRRNIWLDRVCLSRVHCSSFDVEMMPVGVARRYHTRELSGKAEASESKHPHKCFCELHSIKPEVCLFENQKKDIKALLDFQANYLAIRLRDEGIFEIGAMFRMLDLLSLEKHASDPKFRELFDTAVLVSYRHNAAARALVDKALNQPPPQAQPQVTASNEPDEIMSDIVWL